MMRLVIGALRRPFTVLVAMVAIMAGAWLSIRKAPADIFPSLSVPVVYVMQPYAGLNPAQIEGQLVYYYEYHFLYVAGVEHIESESMQGLGVLKIYFHPGTDIGQAMAQVTAMAFRATSMMPPGTLPPFIVRFDAGSIPVGQLVFTSDTKSEAEVQDAALNRARPLLATLPGVSAPPPSGGKVRTIVAHLDPSRLRALRVSPDEVAAALARGELTLPVGSLRDGDHTSMADINGMVDSPRELGDVPIRVGTTPSVFVRDVARIEDGADVVYNVALANGRRTVYMPITKRADASTLDVVRAVKQAFPQMRAQLPEGIDIRLEFDQSTYVTDAIKGLLEEGLLGALFTGLVVLLFLRDGRSALIVVVTIPLSIASAFIALRVAGQTVNIMTLSGLALAVGILVDEATVAIENIHAHLARGTPVRRAVVDAMAEVMAPRLLAMLCVLAVFIPAFGMSGVSASLFPPLAMAVGFAMIASFLISSTVVPVLSVWLLQGRQHVAPPADALAPPQRLSHEPETGHPGTAQAERSSARTTTTASSRFVAGYTKLVGRTVARPALAMGVYVLLLLVSLVPASSLGSELFPRTDAGQLRLRLRAKPGTSLERTTKIVQNVAHDIERELGEGVVSISLANIGNPAWNFPVNALYQSNGGPQDAELLVALRAGNRPSVPEIEERLRKRFTSDFPDVRFSFESGDIISRVLNFGANTPIEVLISGRDLETSRQMAESVAVRLRAIESLRDVQLPGALQFPVTRIAVNRDRAGQQGLTMQDVGRAVVAATSSTVLTTPIFWTDPKNGTPYRVELLLPAEQTRTPADLLGMQVGRAESPTLLADVASVTTTSAPGAISRLNSQRTVSVSANLSGNDLGSAGNQVRAALSSLPVLPKGMSISMRGQVEQMRETLSGLGSGLLVAMAVVVLLLMAFFQSWRAPVIIAASIPAVIGGVVLSLFVTRTTVNIQSLMGAVMCVGIAVANAVLLISFALERVRAGDSPAEAAVTAAAGRLRPILMTTLAMIAGMIPMALAVGGAGEQSAPLGRAVIGGLLASTAATLLCLPVIFAVFAGASAHPLSLAPEDA
jgi:multidrug efflux pump subunit AcrB